MPNPPARIEQWKERLKQWGPGGGLVEQVNGKLDVLRHEAHYDLSMMLDMAESLVEQIDQLKEANARLAQNALDAHEQQHSVMMFKDGEPEMSTMVPTRHLLKVSETNGELAGMVLDQVRKNETLRELLGALRVMLRDVDAYDLEHHRLCSVRRLTDAACTCGAHKLQDRIGKYLDGEDDG